MPVGSDSGTALTVAGLRDQLSMDVNPAPGRSGSTITDDELQPFLDAAVEQAIDYVGPVVPTQFVETYDGGNTTILLRKWPVISVDAVVNGFDADPTVQSAAGTAGWVLDDDGSGLLTLVADGGAPTNWYCGFRNLTVTYTAGRDPMPASVGRGLLVLAQHLYGSKIGSSAARPGSTSAAGGGGLTYALPYFVSEVWRPFMRPPRAS